MKLFNFIAGFFQNNSPESSARLAGILSVVSAIAYAFTHPPTPGVITMVGVMFTNGLVALGLRKGPAGEVMIESSVETASVTKTTATSAEPAS